MPKLASALKWMLKFTEIPLRESLGIPFLNNKPDIGRNNAAFSLKQLTCVPEQYPATWSSPWSTFDSLLRVLGYVVKSLAVRS